MNQRVLNSESNSALGAQEIKRTDEVVWSPPIPPHRHDLEALRQKVLREIGNVRSHTSSTSNQKEGFRIAHSEQRKNLLIKNASFISENEERLLENFASGFEIDPAKIEPDVIPVRTQHDSDLFKYASFQWSVPVSDGYGRKNKFLVKDLQNGKLIGIFALGDPVIGLGARDNVIGWNKDQRMQRLYNVLDSYVLGAVEPYRKLIGGKLLALIAVSNEVQKFIYNKYLGTKTMRGHLKDPTPILITTTSALGRSSVYNRLKYLDQKVMFPVGYSTGFGHFQFSSDLFQELLQLVREDDPAAAGNKYGQGANWKFRTIRAALKKLELTDDLLVHGIGREVFLAPLANNWKEFLRGETSTPNLIDYPLNGIGEYFRERWAIPRSERFPEYRDWKRDSWRASSELTSDYQYVQSQLFQFASKGGIKVERANNDPAKASLGELQILIGTDFHTTSGTTISDSISVGKCYKSTITGRDFKITLQDTNWENGERDIQASTVEGSNSVLIDLLRRLRIGIYPSPKHEFLSTLDLRIALRGGSERATAKKLNPQKYEELTGLNFFECLNSIPNSACGTREELMKDESRRRTDFAAAFPNGDHLVPVIAFLLTRVLPLICESSGSKYVNCVIAIEGRTPELPLRNDL
jgi:hypothetical protein